jgi:phage tail-like protein
MATVVQDPFRGFRFQVDIVPKISASFSEVTIPEITIDTVDYREGTDKSPGRRRLSGMTTYGNVSLKRGITASLDLYEWHQMIIATGTSGQNARRHGTIILFDTDVSKIAAKWSFFHAFPTTYQSSGLNASSAEVMIETLDLVIEQLTRDL